MRYFALILPLIFLVTELSAQSAEEQPHAAFQTNQLSATQLEGFQLKGQEKVSDFVELLEKYQDKTLAPEIRKQCKSMILGLFYKEDNTLYYFDDNQSFRKIKLKKFLNKVSTLEQPIQAKHQQAKMQLPKPTGNIYTLTTNIELFQSNKAKQQVNLEIIIRKEIKEFDSNKIEIWQVFLGDMEQLKKP